MTRHRLLNSNERKAINFARKQAKKFHFFNKSNLYEQLLEICNGLRFVTKNTFVKNIYK